MTREEVTEYIAAQYGVEPDHPWADEPEYAVFRHAGNQKWFALLMLVARSRVGLPGEGAVDLLNVKNDPVMIGSLREQEGFLRAYHMNKERWLSVRLDGSAPDDQVRACIDISYRLTAPKRRKGR